jgi:outer membrane protein OmpA-like peptidoglycan-associated protein
MITRNSHTPRGLASRTAIAVAIATALLAGCASAPTKSTGAIDARNKLTQLQANPDLASRATVALKDADTAVRAAEAPQKDKVLAQHLALIADRKVETARALAQTALAEDQRTALNEQREKARLDSRTNEADAAKVQAAMARADSAEQKLAADQSKAEADAARNDAANAQQQAADLQRQALEMQRQIEEMNAKVTERGVVLTLGDVLFTTGQANLKAGSTGNLNKLVKFLGDHPDRTVVIEGYTDNVGSDASNQRLSERRADSVKAYLLAQGVGSTRLTAVGRGETEAVADNESAEGRQQNRRVEIVISNTPTASR